jgi:hypothetical protein
MKLSKILFTIFILLGILFQGCTNLDEKVYDKLPVEEFGYTESQLNALIAPIYRTLKNIFPSEFFLLSECSSDMAITPTRKGGDWWDGGQFKELRLHTWTPNTSLVRSSYNNAMNGISTCNEIYAMINERENIKNKEQILAEIRGVRAFWYYMLLDYYGNVPIVTDFKDTSLPSTKSRKEVYEFVLSELNAIKNIVREDVSSASYGKITKGVVYTLLAKMYLNAIVWNPGDGPKWQECIDACDTVISLPYIIEPNFKANFAVHNESSKEIIFPIIFSTADEGNHIHKRTLHYLDPIALNLKIEAWNGISAMPPYVKAYDEEDKRIDWSFLIGPMRDPATGEILITAHSRPLIHTIDIEIKYNVDEDGWGQVEQEEGARCFKWEFESGLSGDMENDFAIFRLADVYLMKAEALARLGKDNDEATRLVNEIRKRAFDDPSKLKTSVTLDDIYQERRFELAWEIHSRQDMIRFGTFLDEIPEWKNADKDDHTLIFPIPQSARDANPNLTQNPGY